MKRIFVETFMHDSVLVGVGRSFTSKKKAVEYIKELAEERDGTIHDDGLSVVYQCYFPARTTTVQITMEESELM